MKTSRWRPPSSDARKDLQKDRGVGGGGSLSVQAAQPSPWWCATVSWAAVHASLMAPRPPFLRWSSKGQTEESSESLGFVHLWPQSRHLQPEGLYNTSISKHRPFAISKITGWQWHHQLPDSKFPQVFWMHFFCPYVISAASVFQSTER